MAKLELKNVTFTYPNGFTAIENVALSFETGEKVAIIGQNGAGKTTTVKMMNGLLRPTNGEVFLDGESTKGYSTAQLSRKVGYVFQNPDDQIFHKTIYDEIQFGPKILGFSSEKEKEMMDLAIKLTNLEDVLEENPYGLPLSSRKFIAIAAVIAMDTDVLIFDEPTAGQDLKRVKLLSKIIDTLKNMGKTVIIITHDMEFVVDNFDRAIVMAEKRVQLDANVREVFWDIDVLKRSMLSQPSISRLARETNIGVNHILKVSEMVDELKK